MVLFSITGHLNPQIKELLLCLFNRAARIMDQLAEAGVVGEEEGTKPRKVLMSMEQFEQYIEESV